MLRWGAAEGPSPLPLYPAPDFWDFKEVTQPLFIFLTLSHWSASLPSESPLGCPLPPELVPPLHPLGCISRLQPPGCSRDPILCPPSSLCLIFKAFCHSDTVGAVSHLRLPALPALGSRDLAQKRAPYIC